MIQLISDEYANLESNFIGVIRLSLHLLCKKASMHNNVVDKKECVRFRRYHGGVG